MKRNKITRMLAIAMATTMSVMCLAGCGQSTEKSTDTSSQGEETATSTTDYPTKEISIVVPWNPGGGTDLTVRQLAEEMGSDLGKRMTVTNMPGASGSVGTQDVFDSEKDGYKILGQGMMAFTNAQVMGLIDVSYKEWVSWAAAYSPNVIVVRKDSPYQTIEELIQAMKDNPNTITAGSAGVGTGGHVGATIFAEGVGATFEHIPYDGGNPAIIATLSGEVDFAAQLSMEMIDMIRSGELIALASLSDTDLIIEGTNGEIVVPSIATIAPDMANILPVGESFGIMVPKGTPEDVVNVIENAYQTAVESDSFKALAEEKGMTILGHDHVETTEFLDKLASVVCWTLYDAGAAEISPETVGIPRID